MKLHWKIAVSIIICELVGLVSTPFTIAAIPTWYATLNKPVFSPPNWLFGPAWTLLYMLMGISFALIWDKGWKKKKNRNAGYLFALQLLLNFIWTPIFFGLHAPILGLIAIIALLLSIHLTMKAFYPISRNAYYLLIPYICWVTFATLLNASIVILN